MEIQIWSRSETLGRCFAGATTISGFGDGRCRLRFRFRPRFRSDFIDTTGRYRFRERKGSALMSQQRPMLPVIRTGTKIPVTSLNDDRNKICKISEVKRKQPKRNQNRFRAKFCFETEARLLQILISRWKRFEELELMLWLEKWTI